MQRLPLKSVCCRMVFDSSSDTTSPFRPIIRVRFQQNPKREGLKLIVVEIGIHPRIMWRKVLKACLGTEELCRNDFNSIRMK